MFHVYKVFFKENPWRIHTTSPSECGRSKPLYSGKVGTHDVLDDDDWWNG